MPPLVSNENADDIEPKKACLSHHSFVYMFVQSLEEDRQIIVVFNDKVLLLAHELFKGAFYEENEDFAINDDDYCCIKLCCSYRGKN